MQVEELDQQRDPTDCARGDTSSAPPCCGSGCAVCVLDYWVDDEPGLGSQEEIATMQSMLDAFEKAQLDAQEMMNEEI
ncbi:MAG: hypothetical protein L0220_24515 [Acidobacteria bacterium]|nr:hypothetical protein [Acidobacteriota bacterium]